MQRVRGAQQHAAARRRLRAGAVGFARIVGVVGVATPSARAPRRERPAALGAASAILILCPFYAYLMVLMFWTPLGLKMDEKLAETQAG